MLILEGTFSEDITTTGTSFQEDPCSAVSSVKKKKKLMGKQKKNRYIDKRKEKAKANSDPEI